MSPSRLLLGHIHYTNPQSSSTSLKIEKLGCGSYNSARNPIYYTYPVKLAANPMYLNPIDLPFAELRIRSVDCAVPIPDNASSLAILAP
jgi:hypothetical protein